MNSFSTNPPNRTRIIIQCVIALSSLGLLSACEAQKPTAVVPSASPIAEGRKYSEPALIGKVIDGETKLPLQGVIIYGHYATASGSLGGGTVPGELVKSFETETDANGYFKLDAWDTGDRAAITGEPRGRFPAIALYKPGYDLAMQGLNSIKDFYPRTSAKTVVKAEITDATVDWTKVPFEMRPLKTEKERYTALSNLQYPMRMAGECGWESYSRLLQAQHVDIINMKRRLIPADRRNADDMPKDAYPLGTTNRNRDTVFIEEILVAVAPLHRLRDSSKKSGSQWRCANPQLLIDGAESQLTNR